MYSYIQEGADDEKAKARRSAIGSRMRLVGQNTAPRRNYHAVIRLATLTVQRGAKQMGQAGAKLLERITIDPALLVGKPTIRGLRISVEQILRALSSGVSRAELLADLPELEEEDIRAVLAYAAELVAGEQVFPIQQTGT